MLRRPIKPSAKAAAAALVVIVACAPPPPNGVAAVPPVVVDGNADEWRSVDPQLLDGPDSDPRLPVDIARVWARLFGDELLIAIDWTRTVSPQSMAGGVTLAIDADNNPATGSRVGALPGADLVVELSRQDAPRPGGFGTGVSVRRVTASGIGNREGPAGASVDLAPTFATPRLELRVDLSRTPGGRGTDAAHLSAALQLVAEGATGGADSTAVITIHQERPLPRAVVPRPAVPPPPPGTIRAMTWNVADAGIRTSEGATVRILQAIRPDVVLFDELSAQETTESLRQLLGAALPPSSAWALELGRCGGRQRNMIAVRGGAVRPVAALQCLTQPPEAGELAREFPGDRLLPAVEREREHRLAVLGALVCIRDRALLVVSLDLPSGGYAGSLEDRWRTITVTGIAAALARTRTPHDGVVVGGDFNLVGVRGPLDSLAAAVARLDGHVQVASAVRIGRGSVATWNDTKYPEWASGRLDYLLVGGANSGVVQAFVLEPSDLPHAAGGLQPTDRSAVSGHMPVVADLRVGAASSQGAGCRGGL
ncbi:MAG: endonuclease/exonuclease/phosphatase family protein [Gemmatimonadales bacterium]|nr:endonuclease/exonuclease/phosphatase family protein [Gemmatimonadales bacterium]